MAYDKNKVKQLYGELQMFATGLPSEQDFETKIQDTAVAKKLYNTMSEQGIDLLSAPDEKSFLDSLGFVDTPQVQQEGVQETEQRISPNATLTTPTEQNNFSIPTTNNVVEQKKEEAPIEKVKAEAQEIGPQKVTDVITVDQMIANANKRLADFDATNTAFMDEYKQRQTPAHYDATNVYTESWAPRFFNPGKAKEEKDNKDFINANSAKYDKLRRERQAIQGELDMLETMRQYAVFDESVAKGEVLSSLVDGGQLSQQSMDALRDMSDEKERNEYLNTLVKNGEISNETYKKILNLGDTSDKNAFWYGMLKTGKLKDIATMGLTEIARNADIAEIAFREKAGLELTDDEASLLRVYNQLSQIQSADRSSWFNMGQGIQQSMRFMMELAMTGGVSGMGKALGAKGVMALAKQVGAKKALGIAAKEAGKRTVQSGFKEMVMAPVTPMTYNSLNQNLIALYQSDEEVTPEKMAKAVWDAVATTWTARFTEAAASAIDDIPFMAGMSQAKSKYKWVQEGIENLVKIGQSEGYQNAKNFFKSIGIQSMPMEMLGEVSDNLLSTALTGNTEQLKELTKPEFYGQIALQGLMFGGGSTAASYGIGKAYTAIQEKELKKSYDSAIANLADKEFSNEILNDLRDTIIYEMENGRFVDKDGKMASSSVYSLFNQLQDEVNKSGSPVDIEAFRAVENAVKWGYFNYGKNSVLKAMVEQQIGEFENEDGNVYEFADTQGNNYFVLDSTDDAIVVVDRATGKKSIEPKSIYDNGVRTETNANQWALNYFLLNYDSFNKPKDQQNPASSEFIPADKLIINNVEIPVAGYDAETKMYTVIDEAGNRRNVSAEEEGVVEVRVEPRPAVETPEEINNAAIVENTEENTEEVVEETPTTEVIDTNDLDNTATSLETEVETEVETESEPQKYVAPRGEDNEVIWSEVPVENFKQVIDEEVGADDAIEFIDMRIKSAKQKLTNQKKKKAPEGASAFKKFKEATRALEAEFDYWNKAKEQYTKPVEEVVENTTEIITEEQPLTQIYKNTDDNVLPEGVQPYTVGENIEKRYQDAPKVYGAEDTYTDAEGNVYKGRWVVTEADAVTPSHNYETLQSNEGFPVTDKGKNVNDNDYSTKRGIVETMAADYDARALDEPILVRKGAIVSGNNRTISGQIAAQNGTDTKYKEALPAKSAMRGVATEELGKFKNPRLVFELADPIEFTTETFAKFNRPRSKTKSPVDMAIAIGKQDTSRLVGQMTDTIGDVEKLSDLYQNQNSVATIIKQIVDSGIINQNEMPQFYTEQYGITDAGKDFIETLLVGSVINEDQIRMLNTDGMKQYRDKIASSMLPIAKNMTYEDNFGKELNTAIKYLKEARDAKTNIEGILLDNPMFDKKDYEELAIFTALMLQRKPTEFRQFVNNLNDRAELGGVNLFGEQENAQSVLDDYKQQNKLSDYEQRTINLAEQARQTDVQGVPTGVRGDETDTNREGDSRNGEGVSEEQKKSVGNGNNEQSELSLLADSNEESGTRRPDVSEESRGDEHQQSVGRTSDNRGTDRTSNAYLSETVRLSEGERSDLGKSLSDSDLKALYEFSTDGSMSYDKNYDDLHNALYELSDYVFDTPAQKQRHIDDLIALAESYKGYPLADKILEKAGNNAELHISDSKISNNTPAKELVNKAVSELLSDSGIDVIEASDKEAQQMLNSINGAEAHIVYHGSAAKFDKFDHSYMGTGEGAQAYGWGSYVTEVEGIGKSYAATAVRNGGRGKVFMNGVDVTDSVPYSISVSIHKPTDYAAFAVMKYRNGAKDFIQSRIDELTKQLDEDLLPSMRERFEKAIQFAKDAKDAYDNNVWEYQGKIPQLYTVEIPDDNGKNYLGWDTNYDEDSVSEIVNKVYEVVKDDAEFDFDLYKSSLETLRGYDGTITGQDVYEMTMQFGSILVEGAQKKASEILSKAGFTGVSVPAQFRTGGRADGAKNYVIFNENDLQIKSSIELMQTPNGTVYGWTVNGKIYLTKDGFNPETKIHEYTHIWSNAMKQNNPKGWESIKNLLKDTPIWNEVITDDNYKNIRGNEDSVASEVLSRISGKENAAKMEAEAQKMIDEANGNIAKARVKELINRVKKAVEKFWNWVGTELFKIEEFDSVEQVADRVLYDLLNKTDLGNTKSDDTELLIKQKPLTKYSKYNWLDKKIEQIKDTYKPVKTIQDEIKRRGGVIDDSSDAYGFATLIPGRSAYELENFNSEYFEPMLKTFAKASKLYKKNNNISRIKSNEKIEEYLYARHAIERNKKIAIDKMVAAAMNVAPAKLSDAQANQILNIATILYEDSYTGGNHNINVSQVGNTTDYNLNYDGVSEKLEFTKDEYDNIEQALNDWVTNTPVVNESGLTDKLANKVIDDMYNSQNADVQNALDDLSADIKKCTDYTLDKWKEYGMVSSAEYAAYKNQYKYYIPLRGWEDAEDIDYENVAGNSYNAGEKLISLNKQAKGRTSKADSPISYISQMASSASIVGNRNMLRQKAYNLAKNNQNIISDLIKINDKFALTHKTASEIDNHEVVVKVDGAERLLTFDAGETGVAAATALKGENVRNIQSGILKAVGAATRFQSQMRTSKNPAFIVVNLLRDLAYGNYSYFIKYGPKGWLELQANYGKGFVCSFFDAAGFPLKDTQWGRDYEAYKRGGGQTGFVHLDDIKRLKKETAKIQRRYSSGFNQLSHSVINLIPYLLRVLGEPTENAMRFAAYQTRKSQGDTEQEALKAAKEITVNFNRTGSAKWPNMVWGFFNATVEGLANWGRMGKLTKENKNVALRFYAVNAMLMGTSYALSTWARAFGDDDDEEKLKGMNEEELTEYKIQKELANEYNRISDYVKLTNILIPIMDDESGEKKFIAIPMAQSFRMATAFGTLMADVSAGTRSVEDALRDFAWFCVGEVQPFDIENVSIERGGFLNTLGKTFSPSIRQPFTEVAQNRDFMGNPIVKEQFINESYQEPLSPSYQRANRQTPQFLIGAAKDLNEMLGGTEYEAAKHQYRLAEFRHDANSLEYNLALMLDAADPAAINHILKGWFGGPYDMVMNAYNNMSIDDDAAEERNIIKERFLKSATQSPGTSKYFEWRAWGDYVERVLQNRDKHPEDYKDVQESALYGYKGLVKINTYFKDRLRSLTDEMAKLKTRDGANKEQLEELEKRREAVVLEAVTEFEKLNKEHKIFSK